MNADEDGLQVMDRAQCLTLMNSVPIGRVVYTDQALPAVTPVNFLLDGDDVIIRTGPGTLLTAALHGAVVAFQADDYDAGTRTGWSVTVVGQARAVGAPEEVARLARLPLRSWAPRPKNQFVRISGGRVSGRRIGAAGTLTARPGTD